MATPQQFVPGAPQAPPQQQMHPTVQYGLPGAQPVIVLPPQQPNGGAGAGQHPQPYVQTQGYDVSNLPPAPQPQTQIPQAPPGWRPGTFVQQPVGQQQQPNYQQQQQFQQQQPSAQQYQQNVPPQVQRAQLDANTVLDGPGVAPELRGRTTGQVMQLYSEMARMFFGGQQQPVQQQPVQQQVPQQFQQQAPPQQQVQQPGQPGQRSSVWSNPEQRIPELIAPVIERAIDQRLGPMIQNNTQQAVLAVRNSVAQANPDFAQLEPEVLSMFQGVDPQQLANPQLWEHALDLARGRQMRRQRQGQFQPNGQGRVIPGMQQVPQGGGGFFTEAPTPPMQPQAQQLTPEEAYYAQKFGMSADSFRQWKYGVQSGVQGGGAR